MRVIHAHELIRTASPDVGGNAFTEYARRTIAGVTIEVRSNVEGLAAAFARRYSEHRAAKPVDFTYSVFERADGYVMWCPHDGAWLWPQRPLDLQALLFLVDAAAISALVHYDERLASLHAAGVESFGAAAALAADTEGGKTTTSLACARAGMRIYSDERVLLRDRTVLPFLRRIAPREGSVQLLCSDAGDALTESMRGELPIAWTEVFGEQCVAQPAPLRAVFVLTGKSGLAIQRMEPAQVLRHVGRWFDCRGSALERLSRAMLLLNSVRCYSMTLGAPGETAHAVMNVLKDVAAS